MANKSWANWRSTIVLGTVAAAFFFVCVVNGQAASAKSVKAPAAKQDPAEWKKVVEAAKKEGKIILSGQIGAEWRKIQVEMFQQEYPEITVEYSAMAGRAFGARLRQERQVGKKLWDLRVSGGTETILDAKESGFLAPIRPLLLPEIADDSKWFGGLDGIFADKEKQYVIGYTLYTSPTARVNRDYIKESDLKSSEQLTDPKFKGKIVILTPTAGSSANSLSHMAFMYGKDFVRDILSRQDVIVTDDNRQQVEWVIRGRYPVSTNFAPTLLVPYLKQGLGKNIVELEDKITRLSMGSGTLSIFEGAPHPNAARVYINWLLSQKIQTILCKTVELNSSRTDVPVYDKDHVVDRTRLSTSRISSTEENNEFTDSLIPLFRESLKK